LARGHKGKHQMLFKTLKAALVSSVILVSGIANAGIINLRWDTTVAASELTEVAIGDDVGFVFRFETIGSDLADVVLNASNFIDYTMTFDDIDASLTMNSFAGPNEAYEGYTDNSYFTFDSAGILAQVQQFGVNGTDYTARNLALPGTNKLYNDGADMCIFCGEGELYVNNVDTGLSTTSWIITQTSEVPEPSTLAIFALGMIGLASRRFKKQS